jgi:hypothetical protein
MRSLGNGLLLSVGYLAILATLVGVANHDRYDSTLIITLLQLGLTYAVAPFLVFPRWLMREVFAHAAYPGFPVQRTRRLVATVGVTLVPLTPFLLAVSPQMAVLEVWALMSCSFAYWRLRRPRSPWPRIIHVELPRLIAGAIGWAMLGEFARLLLESHDGPQLWWGPGAGMASFVLLSCAGLYRRYGGKFAVGERSILLLRPFGFDDSAFVRIRTRWRRFLILREGRTLEESLGGPVRRHLGRLVVFGNPTDVVARRTEAARYYVSDRRWQQSFPNIVHRCRAIIAVVPEQTKHLDWELLQIKVHKQTKKLFLVTQPPLPPGRPPFWPACFRTWAEVLLSSGFRPSGATMVWDDIHHTFARLGYEVPAENPGEGALLAFDELGSAKRVAANLKNGREIARAIAAWHSLPTSVA